MPTVLLHSRTVKRWPSCATHRQSHPSAWAKTTARKLVQPRKNPHTSSAIGLISVTVTVASSPGITICGGSSNEWTWDRQEAPAQAKCTWGKNGGAPCLLYLAVRQIDGAGDVAGPGEELGTVAIHKGGVAAAFLLAQDIHLALKFGVWLHRARNTHDLHAPAPHEKAGAGNPLRWPSKRLRTIPFTASSRLRPRQRAPRLSPAWP